MPNIGLQRVDKKALLVERYAPSHSRIWNSSTATCRWPLPVAVIVAHDVNTGSSSQQQRSTESRGWVVPCVCHAGTARTQFRKVTGISWQINSDRLNTPLERVLVTRQQESGNVIMHSRRQHKDLQNPAGPSSPWSITATCMQARCVSTSNTCHKS